MDCKNCKHWKNQQAELEYSKDFGICTCFKWEFGTTNDADIRVLDRGNISDKSMRVHTFESQKNQIPFGRVDRSRYCFVTEESFGCKHFENES